MLNDANEVRAHVARRLPHLRRIGVPQRLHGGYLNDVWHVGAEPQPVIVKAAPPFVAGVPEMALDPRRILFEAESLTLLGPGGRLAELCSDAIRAPVRIDLDPCRHVLIMEDVGTLPDLGARLRDGAVNPAWGASLGAFIGGLHARSAGDAGLAARFDNAAVQRTRLQVQYRAIGRFLADAGFDAPPAAACAAASLGERLLEPGICLTMGDLWPASVLVGDGRLRIIDWELAHFGRPAQDVGHLLAHLWMQAQCADAAEAAGAIAGLAQAFLGHYRAAAGDGSVTEYLKRECAVHMGAEILMRTLGPFRRGYLYEHRAADSAAVREAVGFAVDSLLDGDNAWLVALP